MNGINCIDFCLIYTCTLQKRVMCEYDLKICKHLKLPAWNMSTSNAQSFICTPPNTKDKVIYPTVSLNNMDKI